MDLPQLRAFVVLAEEKHFGRAAARLHITQPALTKRLRGLEASIGTPLFRRDRTGTALTPSGEALLADAIRITAGAEAWLLRARNVAKGTQGHIKIGFGLSTIDIAPRMIAKFRQACPAVTVSLNDFSSAEQIERLETGRLDLGFVRPPVRSVKLSSRALAADGLALATSAGETSLPRPADLEGCNRLGFIMLARRRGPGLRAQIDDWCNACGFRPNITQTADDIQTVLALVAAGIGTSIVPYQAKRLMGDAVHLQRLQGACTEWRIGAVWRSDSGSPALQRFLDTIGGEL